MDPRQNLDVLVAQMRSRLPDGFDWDASAWELRVTNAGVNPARCTLRFGMAGIGALASKSFHPDFGQLARCIVATMSMTHIERPSRVGYDRMILALRLLHDALGPEGGHPAHLVPLHFGEALRAAKQRSPSHVYVKSVAGALSRIAQTVDEHSLTRTALRWAPVVVDLEDNTIAREPLDIEQLLALASLSRREDLHPFDALRVCVMDLCLCGGFRIEEALTLPVDAHVKAPAYDEDGKPILGLDGQQLVHHGLRYWAGKGESRTAMIKAVPTAMVPVMMRALKRAMTLTREVRAVAEHQAAHPGSTLLGAPWDAMPSDHRLNDDELKQVLGLAGGRGHIKAFLRNNHVEAEKVEVQSHRKEAVYQYIVRKDVICQLLYDKSEHRDIRERENEIVKTKDLLFIVPHGISLHSFGLRGTALPIKYLMISTWLSARAGQEGLSVFERLGYLDRAGRPIRLTTHQCRVTLNTIAQRCGVQQLMLARWMGRTRLEVNIAYDRRTYQERGEAVRAGLETIGEDDMQGAMAQEPLPPDEKFLEEGASGHVTPIGVCRRDYAAPPCLHHAAGVEQGFRLGTDADARKATRLLVERTRDLLDHAIVERDAGTRGADRFVMAHRHALAALEGGVAARQDEDDTP